MKLDPSFKTVVIIGLPATGKTTFAELLWDLNPDYTLYHTDDYIEHGYEQSLYVLMSDLGADSNPLKIIEGVQGYRLLRKVAQVGGPIAPDLVLLVKATPEERYHRYIEREESGQKYNPGFDKNLNKVLKDWLDQIIRENENFNLMETTWELGGKTFALEFITLK